MRGGAHENTCFEEMSKQVVTKLQQRSLYLKGLLERSDPQEMGVSPQPVPASGLPPTRLYSRRVGGESMVYFARFFYHGQNADSQTSFTERGRINIKPQLYESMLNRCLGWRRLLRNLQGGRQPRSVPTASECLNQRHRCGHLLDPKARKSLHV